MIEIDNRQNDILVTDEINQVIKSAIIKALELEKFDFNYDISVILTDNHGIKEMNNEFRKIDKETDVLSFPMQDFSKGSFKKEEFDINKADINPESDEVLLGDIVISVQKAFSQAGEYGHSILREIAFLTVHSVLHLLGYDHELEEERTLMRMKEENVLSMMKLFR